MVAEDGMVRRYFGLHGDFTSFSLGNVSSSHSDDNFFLACDANSSKRGPRSTE